MLKQYYEPNKLEIGLDEAGRGCLFGPVCVAGVVWTDEDPIPLLEIKDSKKCSEKKRNILRKYIEDNAIAWSVHFIHHDEIDSLNILKATIKGMHRCIDTIRSQLEIDTILVDGNSFTTYTDEDFNYINHKCIINGDNTYKSIAAASILAKTHRDEYMYQLIDENPLLKKYGLHTNKGYGTEYHMKSIKQYGTTKGHRLSFKPCF